MKTVLQPISRRDLISIFAAFACTAFLSACQTLPNNTRCWQGRFSLTLTSPEKSRNETGRFELIEGADLRRLDLLTPLSGVIARLEETKDGASLWFGSNEEAQRAANLDELLLQNLGFTIPLGLLFAILSDSTGQYVAGEFDGWLYEVSSRSPSGTPQRLFFKHAQTQLMPEVNLILAITP